MYIYMYIDIRTSFAPSSTLEPWGLDKCAINVARLAFCATHIYTIQNTINTHTHTPRHDQVLANNNKCADTDDGAMDDDDHETYTTSCLNTNIAAYTRICTIYIYKVLLSMDFRSKDFSRVRAKSCAASIMLTVMLCLDCPSNVVMEILLWASLDGKQVRRWWTISQFEAMRYEICPNKEMDAISECARANL